MQQLPSSHNYHYYYYAFDIEIRVSYYNTFHGLNTINKFNIIFETEGLLYKNHLFMKLLRKKNFI